MGEFEKMKHLFLFLIISVQFSQNSYATYDGKVDLENDSVFQQAVAIIKSLNSKNNFIRFAYENTDFPADFYEVEIAEYCYDASPEETLEAINGIVRRVDFNADLKSFEKSMLSTLKMEESYLVCEDGTMSDGGSFDVLHVLGNTSQIRFKISAIRLFQH